MKKDTKAKATKPKSTANKPVVTPRATKAKVEVESRHMSELTNKDRTHLEELLRKDAGMLNEGELAHLAARAAYLTTEERKKYGI